jgi:hypothetical protein
MVRVKQLLLTVLAVAGASLLFTGCSTKTEQDSTIPWSRPASWEGGIPGVGGLGSPGSGYR